MGAACLDLASQRTAAMRAATLVVTLMSIGEALVGVFIVALPREAALLLVDAALDARGLIVARMLGVAVLALGITWWMARNDADRLSRYSTEFVVYNIGVGLLFGWAALAASQPTLPWIVCAVHVIAGAAVRVLAFIPTFAATRR